MVDKEFDKMVELIDDIDDNARIHETRWDSCVAIANSEKIATELLKYYHPKITLEKIYNTIVYRILALNFETGNKDYDEGFFDCQKEILKRIDIVAREFDINIESIDKYKIIKYGRVWCIIEPTEKFLLRNEENNDLLKFWSKEQALSYCAENNLEVDEESAY